ncbi:chitin synthase, partial [Plakobranchus ocellatus]
MESDDDLSRLRVLDEGTVLRHLKRRYFADEFYFHEEYGLEASGLTTGSSELSLTHISVPSRPHIFWTAQQSYLRLLRTNTNQCVLVSGESGTGKTESTKHFIDHISFLCKNRRGSRLDEQITRVNPLLEAFGNAVTPLNTNSSRFGKLIELHIDSQSLLCGVQVILFWFFFSLFPKAKIQDYLLEKSRVVNQGYGERNFHIFYYLFAGLSEEQKVYYNLRAARDYRILQHGRDPAFSRKAFKDMGTTFNELIDLMGTVGFTNNDVNTVLTVLAAILHLTNISFQESDDGADSVSVLDDDELASGENLKQMKKLYQADDGRDALAKALYCRLFGWIVSQINENLSQDGTNWENTRTLSILDFAGFERFERNSLDQLCINVANEKLHRFFCHHIFSMEQRDLEAQGVKADLVEFKDNQKLIDLFFQKPQGVFYLLDEESRFPQSTNKSLVAKLNSACASNDHFLPVRGSAHGFTILHYAGKVFYDARGMLERNRDRLGPHLEDVMLKSTNELVKLLFITKEHVTGSYSRSFGALRCRPKLPQVPGTQQTGRQISLPGLRSNGLDTRDKSFVSRYFRKSLTELVSKLENSQPWFVRCVRPNEKSLPATFVDTLVTSQLRYNGLLEIAKIRRDGFPVRLSFEDFIERYKEIATNQADISQGGRWQAENILTTNTLEGWALGHSMVFLQLETQRKLDKKLDQIRRQALEKQRRQLEQEMARKRAEEEKIEREKREMERRRKADMEDGARHDGLQGSGWEQRKDNFSSPQSGHNKVKDWIDVLNVESCENAQQPGPNGGDGSQTSTEESEAANDQHGEYGSAENSHILHRGAWDRFQIVPRDNHPDHASLQTGMKLVKAVCYVITLLVVCSMALASKLAFLTLTTGLVKVAEPANWSVLPSSQQTGLLYPHHRANQGSRASKLNVQADSNDPRPTLTLLAICFPYLCNTVVYTGRSLFGSSHWPSFRMIFVMLAIELAHTAGVCLLAFRVLPSVDMLRALIVLTSVYSGPALMMACSSIMNTIKGNGGYILKSFIGTACFIIQVASVTVCCVQPFSLTPEDHSQLRALTSDSDVKDDTISRPNLRRSHFMWEIPVSLVLVSLSFWENFLEGDFQIFGYKLSINAWKKSLHQVRQRLYIWMSLWKIVWSILLAVALVDQFSFSLSFLQEDQHGGVEFFLFHRALLCDASELCHNSAALPPGLGAAPRRILQGLDDFRFHNDDGSDIIPQVYACATMWHETRSEMVKLLKSMFRMDIDHSARSIAQKYYRIKDPDYYEYETHVFFDDAFDQSEDGEATPNSFVLRFIECLDEAISSVHERPTTMHHPERTPTIYGGRLTWTLPGGTSLVVHLKDKRKIRNRKRWSQVMYLYYLLGYNILANGEAAPEHIPEETAHAAFGKKVKLTAAQLRKRRQSAFYSRTAIFNYVTEDIQRKQRIDTHSKEINVKIIKPIPQFTDEVIFCLESHASYMALQGSKQMKVRGCQVCTMGKMRKNFPTLALQPLLCKSENTYILTLDGDVDFKPEAVRLLVDRMKKNRKVGAACGRIHPIGTGPIVWYQQFEYAIGHWLQKATEHVFGCVLCAPGCFSLFRGSALMDDNVARMYATKSSEAGHYVQFDQGEDRWLSTLLLQQGYRIDYCAAADAYTQAPETFTEFFNQRRRWGPSTLANILDLLGDWRNVVHMNDNVSSLYIFYQTMMFVSTLLGPATVLLMMAGAYQVVFKITVFQSYLLSILPAVGYLLLCMLAKPSTQLSVAAVMSAVFAIVMTIVMVGTVGTAIEGSITSPNVLFMVMILVIFVTSGFLHPRELGDLVPGAIYFICIPAGYLILTIYFLTNLHVVSWGTRETPAKKSKEELEEEKAEKEEKQKRKKESNGIFGWLGLRKIVKEFGEITRQFKDLLYKSNKKQKKKDKSSALSDPDSASNGSTESTNTLLRELIIELRHGRQARTGVAGGSDHSLVAPSKTKKHLAVPGTLPLLGLASPLPQSSDEDNDDGEDEAKTQLNKDQSLEQ